MALLHICMVMKPRWFEKNILVRRTFDEPEKLTVCNCDGAYRSVFHANASPMHFRLEYINHSIKKPRRVFKVFPSVYKLLVHRLMDLYI